MHPYFYQQMMNCFQSLIEKIGQLEQTVKQLQTDIEALKKRGQTNIDKIEYHFDQLKIEKLEGTLNIGITPNDGKKIEDFAVDGQTLDQLNMDSQQTELFQNIQQQVDHYLQTEVPNQLESYKRNHQILIGNQYADLIIEDIRRQIDERIRYYIREISGQDKQSDDNALKLAVIEHMKQDIDLALKQHMELLLHKEGGHS